MENTYDNIDQVDSVGEAEDFEPEETYIIPNCGPPPGPAPAPAPATSSIYTNLAPTSPASEDAGH